MSTSAVYRDGTLLNGKFRIIRLLGAGGMGAVYEIEHELTRHRRALKLLHPDMRSQPEVVGRFLQESSAAGRIGNPHIAETFDAGELDSGEPYLVMELLRGQPLSARLERSRRINILDLCELVRQAARGVQAAHQAGIVHRDLKPDNIFITDRDGLPFVKLLDFGISKFTVKEGAVENMALTREGSMLGTPYYMSPEQVHGDAGIDHRTDIYALGVILYECAAGRRPFEANSLPQLAVLIHEGQYPPLKQVAPDLPDEFVRVVDTAMHRQAASRFQSALQLIDALAPWVAGPLHSLPPPKLPIPQSQDAAVAPASRLMTESPPSRGVAMTLEQGQGTRAAPLSSPFGRNLAFAILGAAGAIAATSYFAFRSPPPAPRGILGDSQSSAISTAAIPSTPPVDSASLTPPYLASSSAAAVPSAPSASAAALASSASTTPASAPPPKGKARSEQKGLATENPFR